MVAIMLFVLDEADEMLSGRPKDQIYDIFRCLPPDVQAALFSAATVPDILDITSKFSRRPVRNFVKTGELALEGIR